MASNCYIGLMHLTPFNLVLHLGKLAKLGEHVGLLDTLKSTIEYRLSKVSRYSLGNPTIQNGRCRDSLSAPSYGRPANLFIAVLILGRIYNGTTIRPSIKSDLTFFLLDFLFWRPDINKTTWVNAQAFLSQTWMKCASNCYIGLILSKILRNPTRWFSLNFQYFVK